MGKYLEILYIKEKLGIEYIVLYIRGKLGIEYIVLYIRGKLIKGTFGNRVGENKV